MEKFWASLVIFFIIVITGPSALAQDRGVKRIAMSNPCINVFLTGAEFPKEFSVLEEPEKSAVETRKKLIGELLDIAVVVQRGVGITRTIGIYITPDVENACAAIDSKRRRVIYVGETWIATVSKENYWSKLFVLAHELGHHVNNHSHEDDLGDWQREYEADRFGGRVVRILNGPLDAALATVESEPVDGSLDHPSKAMRQAAIREGYGYESGIPADLKKRPETFTEEVKKDQTPDAAVELDRENTTAPDWTMQRSETLTNEQVQRQADYLFSDIKDERQYAYSKVAEFAKTNSDIAGHLVTSALRSPDNKPGVIYVLNILKSADKEILSTLKVDIRKLITSSEILDNGTQTMMLAGEVANRMLTSN